MPQLLDALRAKYRTPKDVLRALALDESLLRDGQTKMPKTRNAVAEALEARIKPMLAEDADINDLMKLLDALKANEPQADPEDSDDPDEPDAEDEDEMSLEPNSALPAMGKEKDDKNPDGGEIATDEPAAKLHALLKGKLSPEEMQAVGEILAELAGSKPEGESAPAEDDSMSEDEDDFPKKEEEKQEMKAAMDAAIDVAVKRANENAKAIRDAERAVRPYVGELAIAFDSAEGVYRHTLKSLGVKDADKVHASALPALLNMVPVPGARQSRQRDELAMDAAQEGGFHTMFPEAARIKSV